MPDVIVEAVFATVKGVFALVLFYLVFLAVNLEFTVGNPARNPANQPVGTKAVAGKLVQVF